MSLLVLMTLLTAVAGDVGFRMDGSGVWKGDLPALDSEPLWRTPLASWGNASPVAFRDMVCVTSEPTSLHCLDATTGGIRWTGTSDYGDTLSGAEAEAWATRLAGAPGLQAELEASRREFSRLRRELRRAGSGITGEQLEAASAKLDTLRDSWHQLEVYLTSRSQDIIGYASPTPITDGNTLFTMFGSGVVTAWAPDGSRRWTRWLGAPIQPMNGYDSGTTASPMLVEGSLIVGYGRLQALDPATGSTRWIDTQQWRHYASASAIEVDGTSWLITPDGRGLRTSDGKEGIRGLADIWYASPLGVGDVGYWVGGKGRADDPLNVTAAAWRFTSPSPGTLEAEKLWHTRFPGPARVYMAPTLHEGLLYTATHDSELVSFDAATGELIATVDLDASMRGTPYQGVSVFGSQLAVCDDRGSVALLTPGRSPTLVSTAWLGEEARSLPALGHGHAYVRTLTGLAAWRAP